jgi:hypothetical protein
MVPWFDQLSDSDILPEVMILCTPDGNYEPGMYVQWGGHYLLAMPYEELCTLIGRSYQLQVVVAPSGPQTFQDNSLLYRNGFPIAGVTISAGVNQIWTIAYDPTLNVPPSIQDQLDLKAPKANPTFTGTVSGITKTMVGLSNVDNTSDSDKPISIATQNALNLKVDKITGKGLSTEDYSTAEKNKLAGIAAGATANSTDAFLLNRANHTGTQSLSTVTLLRESLFGRQAASTALITGGNVTINPSLTSVDIAAGSALFVDYTDPKAPLGTQLDFGPTLSVSLTYLTTAPATYLGINSSGVIIQQTTPFTATQRRSIVPIGLAVHTNNTTVNIIDSLGSSGRASLNQLQDLMEAIGSLNLSGNHYTPLSALTIKRSSGTIFKYGCNFPANPLDPHKLVIAAESPVVFRYRMQNSAEFSNTSNVDPNNYDMNGVLTSVPNNHWTVQHITLFQSGLTRLQYGQAVYNNYSDAIRGLGSETFVAEPNIAANGIARCLIVVRKNATNLSNTTQAVFVDVGKFGALFTAGL